MQVSIQITGVEKVYQKLNRLGQGLYNFNEAMRLIGQDLVSYYANEGFGSQGGVFDHVWPRLSSKYSVYKAKKWPGRGILEASGAMRHGFIYSANSTSVAVDNQVDYFKYHQSTAPRTKMPWRPSMGVNDQVKERIKTIIEADIRLKIDRA